MAGALGASTPELVGNNGTIGPGMFVSLQQSGMKKVQSLPWTVSVTAILTKINRPVGFPQI